MPSVLTKPPEPGETVVRTTKTTTYTHNRAWLPWLAALLLVPLAIAALYLYPFGGRDKIQDDLSAKARESLAAAGIAFGDISVDGDKAVLCGVPAGLVDQARQKLQAISGIGSVQVNGDNCGPVGGPGTPTTALALTVRNGQLVLTGIVADDAAKDSLAQAAAAAGIPIDNQLSVQAGAALPVPAADLGRVAAALTAVPGDHALTFDGLNATLTGTVSAEEDKMALEDQLKQIAPSLTIDDQLTVAGPLQQQISAALQQNPIAFEPDSATLTPQGQQAAQQIAALIKGGGDVSVEVGGHVASVASPQDGQALSAQRAVSVKEILVGQGIDATKITTVGFGDTKPIAGNDTPEGQALNRRVEIIVR